MGRYRLLITPSAEREIDKLPRGVRIRIIGRIQRLPENPRPPGCKKLVGEPHYRLRQGDYRVIYGINDTKRVIDIVHVGHRRDIYR